ncbi:uncharacterized protein LOC144419943 [Styela clava]
MMSYQKVIAKINENTIQCTDFYDFAEPHGVFNRKLNVDVTPQLEEIDFYKGGRIPAYDYVPESSDFKEYLEEERESGIRKEIQLDELFDSFKQGHVCFVGPAGSGKSTLMKATSRNAVRGKYFPGNIRMVPYIECKQYKSNWKVTASELIFNNLTKEERGQAIDIAKTHPEEVLFMLDSLDTLQYTVDGVYEVINLDEPAYPEVIMWNFLSGKLFPGCRIISSSREHSIRNFWGEVRPDKVIALAGLTMESIKEIISGYEGDEEAEKIMEFLKIKAPLLLFLCTTPVMLVYTLIALKLKSDFKPNTMTGIMIEVMQSILRSSHTHQENILEVLGKLKELSYIGTVERRVLFTEDDFRQVHLKPEEATDLAILAPGGIYRKLFQGIHLLYFQHQSIQEMLTSFYILGLDLKPFKKFVDKHLHTGHFVFVRRMICGFLLNPTVYEAAGILLEEIKDLEEKQDILKESLQLQLKKISNKSDLLDLFNALNEAKDGMSGIVKSSLDKIDMFRHPLSIIDVHVTGSVASYCTSLTMEFTACDLKSASLQTLASGLKGSNVKIMSLHLHGNTNMGVEGLSSVGQILSNQTCVEGLGLTNCNLSSDQLQAFKSSIGNRTKIMQLLLEGNTNMGVEGLSLVGHILSNQSSVDRLGLENCNLSSDQLKAFKSSLGNTEIMKFYLSRNTNMGVEGLSSVGQILSNQSCVKDLGLSECNLSADQLQAFESSLGNTEIMKLWLIGNTNMGVEGLSSVGQILSNQSCVEQLSLRNCNLSSDQLEAFKSSMGNTEIMMFYLSKNTNMGVGGLTSVGKILSNQSCVKELSLRECNPSADQLQAFKSSLGNTEIMKFYLQENTNMGVEGLSSVGQILSNQSYVEQLSLENCNLSSDQLQAFKSSLGNTEIGVLEYDEDRIANHEDIVAVANLLPNVTYKLSLQRWKIADEDKEILQNQLYEIESEKLEIYLDGGIILKSQRKSADATTNVVFSKQLQTTTSKAEFGSPDDSFRNTEEKVGTSQEVGSPRSELLLSGVEAKQSDEEVTKQLAKPTQHSDTSSRTTCEKRRKTSDGDGGPRSKIPTTEVEEIQQEDEISLYALPQIENVSSQRSGSDILLTWNEVPDSNVLYNIEIFCDDVKLRKTHIAEIPQYRMKSPTLGKKYRFQVWAKDELGNIGVKTQSNNVIKVENIAVGGGITNINECKVFFPDGTFNEQTKVWMSLGLDNSICPAQYYAITPALDISAESTLHKSAVVQMKSWRLELKKEDVDILHFTNDTDWNVIKPDLVTHDRTIEFRCQEFSRVIATIKRWWYPPVLKENFLYIMGHNQICITFFSLSELVERNIITYYESRGAHPVPTRFNQLILRHGDKIHLQLRIEGGPGDLQFNEPNGHIFSVDDDFLMASRHDFEFEILPDLQPYPKIIIKCVMVKNEDENDRKVIKFTFPLKPPERRGPPNINFAGANIENVHLPERENQNNQQMGQNDQGNGGAVGGNQAI